jgi:Rrf2 family protein
MKLSTKTRYGTRLILVSIGDISKRQDISVKYLEQIVRPLKKASLVVSTRGPKGGHSINKAPHKITLGEIVRLLQSSEVLAECVSELSQTSATDLVSVAYELLGGKPLMPYTKNLTPSP